MIMILSLVGFLDYIVAPSFKVCGDMIELLQSQPTIETEAVMGRGEEQKVNTGERECIASMRVWEEHIVENKRIWKSKLKSKPQGKLETQAHTSLLGHS